MAAYVDAREHLYELGPDIVRQHTDEHLRQHLSSRHSVHQKIVSFQDKNDLDDPHNWPLRTKLWLSTVATLVVFNATFSSSAPSGNSANIGEYFDVSNEVTTLTVSIFVAGYMIGPIVWGPASEFFGRKPVFIVSMLFYTGWNAGCALSPNIGSLLVFRLLSGTCAAAPLSNSGGLISDLFKTKTRGIAMCIYAVAPFAGPALGPIVGGFIETSGATWRWLFWTLTMYSGFCLLLVLFIPETYGPILLKKRAKRLRKATGDQSFVAPLELISFSTSQLSARILLKPFRLVLTEPMLQATILYQSYLFGILYLFFEAFPIVFQQGHGFNSGIGGLMFLPFMLGAYVGVAVYIIFLHPRYRQLAEEKPDGRPEPESRLPMAMIGAPLVTIAFFWFAWTSNPKISFWAPLMSTPLFGFGFLFIFGGLFNYIVDAFTENAASALAASAIFRSSFGAAFPLFARQMYSKLGTAWATSLLGFLALIMMPIPYVLYKCGPALRARSKNARS